MQRKSAPIGSTWMPGDAEADGELLDAQASVREELAELLPDFYQSLRDLVADATAGRLNPKAHAEAMRMWRYYAPKMRAELKRRGLLDELTH